MTSVPTRATPDVPVSGSFISRLNAAARRVHAALFPPICAICGEFLAVGASPLDAYLCPPCANALDWYPPAHCCRNCGRPVAEPPRPGLSGWQRCPACADRPFAWDGVVASFGYEDPVRRWILKLKYYREDPLAPMLGALLARTLAASRLLEGVDWVVPVPLHPSRTARRGFSQSHLLAHRALAALERDGLPHPALRTDLIRRHRPTRPQTELAYAERRANVEEAFSIPPGPKGSRPGAALHDAPEEALAGAHVLLVDDVLTTGATMDACARTLKAAGARRVSAVVLARA